MKYPVFFQALALTIVVFVIGLYIGISLEQKRVDEINEYVVQSEVSLLDIIALNDLIGLEEVSCESIENSNFEFVDKIYQEARLLEEYESSGRLIESLKPVHKKYDVLRSYLWLNLIKTKEVCDSNFSTIVYLYNYAEEDLAKKAEQNVWSKILFDIKQERENVLLIPIARDTDLVSLNSIISQYKIDSYPAVIINEEVVFTELITKEEIEVLLN
jgi:hypothetical protein